MAAIFNAMTNTQPPALRDIYRYLGRGSKGDTPYSTVNNTEMDDSSFYGPLTANSSFDYLGGGDQGPRWGIRQGSFLENLNKQYGDNTVQFGDRGGNDQAQRWRLGIDSSKLPKTRFGDVHNTMMVDEANMSKIKDPRLVYDDPVYGKITHISNYKRDKFLPMLPAIVGMGMGGMLGAAGLAGNGMSTASGLFRGAQGLFNGGNPLAAIANAGLGFAGVPAFARPFLNMAISQMIKNKGKP